MSYTLILAEKPDAARRIAEAIADKKPKAMEKRGAKYYEFTVNGKKHISVPAVGHLFVLSPIKSKKSKGWNYPIFSYEWIPTYTKKGTEWTRKYYENIKEVAKDASKFIDAADVDNEGEVLLFNVLRFICGVKDAKRMKFSTLTKDELIESYKNMSAHILFPMLESGLTRHELDWSFGINTTRALTLALKSQTQKGFTILSSGRVQSPVLAMLLKRELVIRKFKSKPFWQLELHVKADGIEIVTMHKKGKFWKKDEVNKILKNCKGKDTIVKNIKKRKYKQKPPFPFNTTDLLSESYSQFKFSPRQTMRIAESLYQAGYISYPRSSSQKLPAKVNYVKILKGLAKISQYKKFAESLLAKKKLAPNEGPKIDPAHPAVYSTWEVPNFKKLTAQQKKIYDLIARRTLATFGDKALRESMNVTLAIGKNNFVAVGKRTIELGWTEIYKKYLAFKEQLLPDLEIGQKLKVLKIDLLSKETQPPGRYSQGSIIKEMEKRGLGTRATRSEILQTLYDRKYIAGKSIQVTKLGETVTKVLKEFCPRILSEELTRHFEKEMEQVFNGKKKREKVVKKAQKFLTGVLKDFKKNERKIGKILLKGLETARKEENKLGVCPNCKTGELRIIFSRFSGKRFVGCSNYFRCKKCGFTRPACKCKCEICGQPKGKCKCSWKEKKWYPTCQTGFPLPAVGMITPLNKSCEMCALPMIQVWRKGKRPFRMCINHLCKSKESWNKKPKT